jgi:hypothetical protein
LIETDAHSQHDTTYPNRIVNASVAAKSSRSLVVPHEAQPKKQKRGRQNAYKKKKNKKVAK